MTLDLVRNIDRISILILFSALLIIGGCSDDDNPTATGCPGATVEGLTPVQSLTVSDDPYLHATVKVTWTTPLPNPAELEVDHYEVRVHTSGEDITAENWCQLPVLAAWPSQDKPGFISMKFDHRNEYIIPGATESFAVRPIYENGDPGPVGPVVRHRLTPHSGQLLPNCYRVTEPRTFQR